MDDFEGFEETVEAITSNVVKMAQQLELEVEAEDVRELLESHDQPLSDEGILAMEEQRKLLNEQEAMPEDTAQPKEMTTKELEIGIAKIDDAIAYWERVDPNFDRSSKVNSGLEHQIACYRELLRERKKTSMRQTSLCYFFKKLLPQPTAVTPPPNPSDSELSTSAPALLDLLQSPLLIKELD
jgi:hypothetical protein